MTVEFLKDFKTYPRMVHWFNPVLLAKLLNNVITSAMFGQYADRRLMVAALDSVPAAEHVRRATSLVNKLELDGDDALWVDFVADLGDGFDSTYAVASVLAKKEWQLDGITLPRGQMLIMGGDQVYPLASFETYQNQLWQPYSWAFPDHDRKADEGVPLFAIPGNHDWYDGLVQFLAYFSREKHTHFGSWRTQQRRSYFAVQLTATWWIWAIDIQLADNMDQPQYDYFTAIARSAEMHQGSRIILCSAEPGWLYTDTNTKSWRIMDFAVRIAHDARKDFTIPLLLSGDTHHYSRYSNDDGSQFVTSGGGGAFLHPTHQLERDISVRWVGNKKVMKLGNKNVLTGGTEEPAVYPPMTVSQRLLWRNLWFAFTNWDFSILMGLIYFTVGVLIGLRDKPDMYVLTAVLIGAGILGYTTTQENVSISQLFRTWRKRLKWPDQFKPLDNEKLWLQSQKAAVVVSSSLVHAGAHVATATAAAHYFRLKYDVVPTGQWYDVWIWIGVLLVEMGLIGFLAGGTIFGLNMLITCRWLRMNRNDAFSALRIGKYNNFIRLKIKGDTAQLYAIGLEDIPSRDDWNENPAYKQGSSEQPRWIPTDPLRPHLIETITISGKSGPV